MLTTKDLPQQTVAPEMSLIPRHRRTSQVAYLQRHRADSTGSSCTGNESGPFRDSDSLAMQMRACITLGARCPNALPGKDLLPPSPLLRLTDVQHHGPNWTVMADPPLTPRAPRVVACRHRGIAPTSVPWKTYQPSGHWSHWRFASPDGDASLPRAPPDYLPTAFPGVADRRGRRTCRPRHQLTWTRSVTGVGWWRVDRRQRAAPTRRQVEREDRERFPPRRRTLTARWTRWHDSARQRPFAAGARQFSRL